MADETDQRRRFVRDRSREMARETDNKRNSRIQKHDQDLPSEIISNAMRFMQHDI